MKTFTYKGEEITITPIGGSQYRIEGLETVCHTSDPNIYDFCDGREKDSRDGARRIAYLLLCQ